MKFWGYVSTFTSESGSTGYAVTSLVRLVSDSSAAAMFCQLMLRSKSLTVFGALGRLPSTSGVKSQDSPTNEENLLIRLLQNCYTKHTFVRRCSNSSHDKRCHALPTTYHKCWRRHVQASLLNGDSSCLMWKKGVVSSVNRRILTPYLTVNVPLP